MITLLTMANVNKSYSHGGQEQVVLNNLSLTVRAGSLVAITGESGSGKSTLLNMIAGLDRADSGCIMLGDFDVTQASESRLAHYRNQQLGFVFQFHFLLDDFTVLENIAMPALIAGSSHKVAKHHAQTLLNAVQLSDKAQKFPSQLSGGERQRVAVARALMNHPQVLLADEPTGSLDAKNAAMVIELLLRLTRENGATLLMVTHDSALAALCEQQVVLTKN